MTDRSFTVTAGDSVDLRFDCFKPPSEGGGPFSLAAFDSLVFLAKRTPNAPDAQAVMTKEPPVGITIDVPSTDGVCRVKILSEDWEGLLDGPRRLYYRLKVTSGDDTTTLAKGELAVDLV